MDGATDMWEPRQTGHVADRQTDRQTAFCLPLKESKIVKASQTWSRKDLCFFKVLLYEVCWCVKKGLSFFHCMNIFEFLTAKKGSLQGLVDQR